MDISVFSEGGTATIIAEAFVVRLTKAWRLIGPFSRPTALMKYSQ